MGITLNALIAGPTAACSDFERNQLCIVAAVGPHFLWRTRDEATKSSLDRGTCVAGFCPWRAGANRPAGDRIAKALIRKTSRRTLTSLRADVRQQKAEMVGVVMQLSAADAAKFWPIYEEYDEELAKLNDQRVANIEEYASTYDQMTDDKADELIHKAMSFRKQRSELLAKYYELVKQALGGITAARFVQVEDQLLLIIDLQIDSSLPVVGQSS